MRHILFLFLLLSSAAQAQVWNREPLQPNSYAPLPLGFVKPEGWLKQQLRIQADGLTGHVDEFWQDLGPNSGWLGGTGESWERGPYFLDGLVPIAFELNDERLIAKARKWVDWTLSNQKSDGRLGPEPNKGKFQHAWQAQDWWPNMVMLKVLTQWQEATGDPRVIPAMTKYLHYHLQYARERPLIEWAKYRWGEELISILWLYNRTGDPKLLELGRVLAGQSFDWMAHFKDFRYPAKVPKKETNLATHGVNNAMAWKYPAVWWQLSGNKDDFFGLGLMLNRLDKHHGQPTGMYTADEHYAGKDPSQGTELCAVVEAMYSLAVAEAISGINGSLGDRWERIAYNAHPATYKPDMWAHQYDQQVNQVMCSRQKRLWETNGNDSNLFGLEPNFACCLANMHQGWPKFVSHLWMAARGGGLALMAYGPSSVEAKVANGVPVTIIEETEYPFRETVRLTVSPGKTVKFPLQVRIPEWAIGAVVQVGGKAQANVRPGLFHVIDRTWKTGDVVEITLPMKIRTERAFRNSLVVARGPLLYSLQIGEDWRKIGGTEPHADWEVHPTSPWNYGLVGAPSQVELKPVTGMAFSQQGAPVTIKAKARRLPQWEMVNGSAGPLPESPVNVPGSDETVTLIPYGSAKLRVTTFPEVR